MRILLLCSALDGLSQRAWLELREAGHEVVVQIAGDDDAVLGTWRIAPTRRDGSVSRSRRTATDSQIPLEPARLRRRPGEPRR